MFLALAGVAVVLAAAAGRFFFLLNAPIALAAPVELEVGRGENPHRIAERLEASGVVRSAPALMFLARTSGRDRGIRYGTHRFEGALTPSQVLEELNRAPLATVRMTVAEGLTIAEAGAGLEREGIVTAEAYRRAACDPALLATLPAAKEANCAEGFLFPDTYNLAPEMTADEIVRLQVDRFRTVIDELIAGAASVEANAIVPASAPEAAWHADPARRAEVIGKAVVLASIIEAEAKRPEERALISSVFHNRLKRGIRLQADPTVIYGLETSGTPWEPARLYRHLRNPSPYNTYAHAGLPPGPICNPGRDALHAALAPAATKFLYFVSRGDGSHRFSATLAEHNRAVVELRRVAKVQRDAAARALATAPAVTAPAATAPPAVAGPRTTPAPGASRAADPSRVAAPRAPAPRDQNAPVTD